MAAKSTVTFMLLALFASAALGQAPGAAPTVSPPSKSPSAAPAPKTATPAPAPTQAPPVSVPSPAPPTAATPTPAGAPTMTPTSSPPAPVAPSSVPSVALPPGTTVGPPAETPAENSPNNGAGFNRNGAVLSVAGAAFVWSLLM
ncbi:classical arabinogalactan protein 5 [Ricinus communis]|uniref:classical arabinogalactan protein 5 n=1 Tax=Ricinus communis TaxID=3988 RepID=UPI00201A8763|nr:classical arabinogalactan protein 5 [Ricinus communis]